MGKMSKKILAGLLAVVLVLGGILLYNLQMNKSFITTFYSVTVDKPVEDLRIVLLSDLHLHEYGEDNADLVRKIQNLAPDLIAVAGDMNIDTDTDYHVVLDLMHQLVDIAPPPATTSGGDGTRAAATPFLTTFRPPASTG